MASFISCPVLTPQLNSILSKIYPNVTEKSDPRIDIFLAAVGIIQSEKNDAEYNPTEQEILSVLENANKQPINLSEFNADVVSNQDAAVEKNIANSNIVVVFSKEVSSKGNPVTNDSYLKKIIKKAKSENKKIISIKLEERFPYTAALELDKIISKNKKNDSDLKVYITGEKSLTQRDSDIFVASLMRYSKEKFNLITSLYSGIESSFAKYFKYAKKKIIKPNTTSKITKEYSEREKVYKLMPTDSETVFYDKEQYEQDIINEAKNRLQSYISMPETANVSESLKNAILDFKDATVRYNRVNDIAYTFGKLYEDNYEKVRLELQSRISMLNNASSDKMSMEQFKEIGAEKLELQQKLNELTLFSALQYTGINKFMRESLFKHYKDYTTAFNYYEHHTEEELIEEFDRDEFKDLLSSELKLINDKYGISNIDYEEHPSDDREREAIVNIKNKGDIYRKVIKHFTLLFNEASSIIGNNYNVDVTLTGDLNESVEKKEEEDTQSLDGDPDAAIYDTLREEKETEKESWHTEALERPAQLNKDVLEMFRNIPKRINGKIVRDDAGIPQYYNPLQIKLVMIEQANKAVNIEEFDRILNTDETQEKYPFIADILEKMNTDLKLGKDGKGLWTKTWCDVNVDNLNFMTINVDFWNGNVETIHLSEPEGVYTLIQQWSENQIGYITLSNKSIYDSQGIINEPNLQHNINIVSRLKDIYKDKKKSATLIQNREVISKFKKTVKNADEILKTISESLLSIDDYKRNSALKDLENDRREINKFLDENRLKGYQSEAYNLVSINDVAKQIREVLLSLGADVSVSDIVKATENDPSYIFNVLSNLNTILSGVKESIEELKDKKTGSIDNIDSKRLINSYGKAFSDIAYPIAKISEDTVEHSVRIGNKSRYAHQQQSELGYFIKMMRTENAELRDKFFEDEYNSFFFRQWNPETQSYEYRNYYLRCLADKDTSVSRDLFDRLMPLDFDGSEYKDWDERTRWRVMYETYWSRDIKHKKPPLAPVYFPLPTLSNLTHTEFIQFHRCEDVEQGFVDVVRQEFDRIKVVLERRKNKIPEIENFDKRGSQFLWFPELNYRRFILNENNEPVQVDENTSNSLSFYETLVKLQENNMPLNGFIKSQTNDIMEDLYQDQLNWLEQHKMITEDNEFHLPVKDSKRNWDADIRDFFYQFTFARIQIEQLFITDRAFFKDDQDMIKRIKEMISSTKRMQTNKKYTPFHYAKEYRTTAIVKDFITPSIVLNETSRVLENNQNLNPAQKDVILSIYNKINTTDAQGILNIDSFAAIMDMQGLWTKELDTIKDKLKNGTWTFDDFINITSYIQTIKPFNFTNIVKDSGVELNDGYESGRAMIRTPFQNKNSEIVLLGVFASIAANPVYGGTSKLFKALEKFMHSDNPEEVIDVIQFESTTKHGAQGRIEINYYKKVNFDKVADVDGVQVKYADYEVPFLDETTKTFKVNSINGKKFKDFYPLVGLLSDLYSQGKIAYETYAEVFSDNLSEEKLLEGFNKYKTGRNEGDALGKDEIYLYKTPYNKFGIITSTPEHGIDRMQLVGTQFMTFIPADMNGIESIKVGDHTFTPEQFKKLYNLTYVTQLYNSFEGLKKEFQSIEKLQKLLLQELKSSTYDSPSMRRALELVTINVGGQPVKTFNIPLFERSQALRIENFVNSIIRNRITKRKMKGGSYLQATAYLLEDRPEIIYMNDKGEEVTFKKFKESPDIKKLNIVTQRKQYNKYVKTQHLTVKHYEMCVPCYDTKLFGDCIVEKSVNGKKTVFLDANKLDDALREGVGYRVPTEGFSFMFPTYIKQFLPQFQGSAVMLPLEITAITGDDNDGDKIYNIFYENRLGFSDKNRIRLFAERNIEGFSSLDDIDKNFIIDSAINEVYYRKPFVETELDNINFAVETLIDELNENSNFYKLEKEDRHYEKLELTWGHTLNRKDDESDSDYDFRCLASAIKNGSEKELNNLFITFSRSRLQEPKTAARMLTPGEPVEAKRIAAINTILENIPLDENNQLPEGYSYRSLKDKSLDELEDDAKKFMPRRKSTITPISDIQSAMAIVSGQDVISISAVNNTSHAKNSYFDLKIDAPFEYNGKKYKNFDDELNDDDIFILDAIANILDVSVDNVKNMVLGKLGVTKRNLPVLYALVRSGVPLFEAIAFIKQPIFRLIENYCNEKNMFKLSYNVVYEFRKELNEKNKQLGEQFGYESETAFYTKETREKPFKERMQNYKFPMDDMLTSIAQADKQIRRVDGGLSTRKFMDFLSEDINDNIPDEEVKNFLKKQWNVLYFLENYIMPIVGKMEIISNATRTDTSSGSNHGSNAHVISQLIDIDKLFTTENNALTTKKSILSFFDYDSEDLLDKVANSANPYTQASFTFGIGATQYLLRDYFPEYNTYIYGDNGILEKLRSVSTFSHNIDRKFSERTIKTIINDFYTYLLSNYEGFNNGMTLSGDLLNSFEEVQSYYINQFPDDFMEWKKKNPSVSNIPLLNRLNRQGAWKKKLISTIDLRNSANLNQMRSQYEIDFETASLSPDLENIGFHLEMYNFFRSGFGFSPNGFASFADDVVLSTINGGKLLDYYRQLPYFARGAKIEPFVEQYVEHHLDNYEFSIHLRSKGDYLDFVFENRLPKNEFDVNIEEKTEFRKYFDNESKRSIPHKYVRIQKDNMFYYYKLSNQEGPKAYYTQISPKGIEYNAQEYRYDKPASDYSTCIIDNTAEARIALTQKDIENEERENINMGALQEQVRAWRENKKVQTQPENTADLNKVELTPEDAIVGEKDGEKQVLCDVKTGSAIIKNTGTQTKKSLTNLLDNI